MDIGFLIDLDGTIYKGNELIPGAKEFVDFLIQEDIPHRFLTNNSSKTPEAISGNLSQLGLDLPSNKIITSAVTTANYLLEKFNKADKVFVIGEKGLISAITSVGFEITENTPRIVVIGLDRNFNYQKLKTAVYAIYNGANFIATNTDPVLLTEDGIIPGTGALVEAVRYETKIDPIIIGKPNKYIFMYAIEDINLDKSRIIMIGDNIKTDIFGANQQDIRSILTLTGITGKIELSHVDVNLRPNLVVDSLLSVKNQMISGDLLKNICL